MWLRTVSIDSTRFASPVPRRHLRTRTTSVDSEISFGFSSQSPLAWATAGYSVFGSILHLERKDDKRLRVRILNSLAFASVECNRRHISHTVNRGQTWSTVSWMPIYRILGKSSCTALTVLHQYAVLFFVVDDESNLEKAPRKIDAIMHFETCHNRWNLLLWGPNVESWREERLTCGYCPIKVK